MDEPMAIYLWSEDGEERSFRIPVGLSRDIVDAEYSAIRAGVELAFCRLREEGLLVDIERAADVLGVKF